MRILMLILFFLLKAMPADTEGLHLATGGADTLESESSDKGMMPSNSKPYLSSSDLDIDGCDDSGFPDTGFPDTVNK